MSTSWRTENERTVRYFLPFGNQRVCADEAVSSDFGAIENDCLDADQRAVPDGAAVNHGHVADADIFSNGHRETRVPMYHATVLQLRVLADGDDIVVATHNDTLVSRFDHPRLVLENGGLHVETPSTRRRAWMFGRRSDLPLRRDATSRFLPWVIGVMV